MRLLASAGVLSCGSSKPVSDTDTAEPNDTDASTNGSAEATSVQEPSYCVVSTPVDELQFPEQVAAAVCSLRSQCGCDDADSPQCGQEFLTYFTDLQSYATSNGLKYDANCAARRIQEYLAAGCNASDVNNHDACSSCYVYSGAVQPGEICATVDPLFDFGILSTCASAETECYIGKCVPPGASEGEWCWGTKGCSSGLACSAQGTVCVSAKEGEPCLGAGPSDMPCADGLWCDSTVCRARKSTGSDCQKGEECITLFCDGAHCKDRVIACELVNPMYWPFYVPGSP